MEPQEWTIQRKALTIILLTLAVWLLIGAAAYGVVLVLASPDAVFYSVLLLATTIVVWMFLNA